MHDLDCRFLPNFPGGIHSCLWVNYSSSRAILSELSWDSSWCLGYLLKEALKFLEGLLRDGDLCHGTSYLCLVSSLSLDEEGLEVWSSFIYDGLYFLLQSFLFLV